MTKTTKVAADRAYDQTKSVLPAEFARGVMIEHPPSAQALKLMHLMVAVAGGRMAENVTHEISGGDMRQIKGMRKHDKASLTSLFSEIRATTIIFDDVDSKQVTIGGFLDEAKVDYRYDDKGDIKVRWWFSKTFKDIAATSTHWAIMDRQTVFALRSKYSIHLFQHIASLVGLDHKTSESLTVPQIRALLAVPEGKLMRWDMLKRNALNPAIAEINQLSRFDITATPIKRGRYIETVEIAWEPKPDPTEAKLELDKHTTGRKARGNGTAEAPVVAFPASGDIRYAEPFGTLAKTHGNGKDIDLIGKDFRNWCAAKKIPLDGRNIARQFETFCKGVSL